MQITHIEVWVGEFEDHCVLITDVPGQIPTRRSNIAPFDTREGNRLRLRFTIRGGKGVSYCKKNFPGIPLEVNNDATGPKA